MSDSPRRYEVDVLPGEVDFHQWSKIAYRLYAQRYTSNGVNFGFWLVLGAEVCAFGTGIAVNSMPSPAFLIGLGSLAFLVGFVYKGRPDWMQKLSTKPDEKLITYTFDDQGFEIKSQNGNNWKFLWSASEVIYEDEEWLTYQSQGLFGPIALAPLRRAGILNEFMSRVQRPQSDG